MIAPRTTTPAIFRTAPSMWSGYVRSRGGQLDGVLGTVERPVVAALDGPDAPTRRSEALATAESKPLAPGRTPRSPVASSERVGCGGYRRAVCTRRSRWTGPARARASADPPRRRRRVEFTDGSRTVSLPVREARAACSPGARAGRRPHPSVAAAGRGERAGAAAGRRRPVRARRRRLAAARGSRSRGRGGRRRRRRLVGRGGVRRVAGRGGGGRRPRRCWPPWSTRCRAARRRPRTPRVATAFAAGSTPSSAITRPASALGRRTAGAGHHLAARRGRRGGARRRVGAAGAPGARRAGPAPPVRRGRAVDRLAGGARVRRARPHPRRHRAARRGPRLAGARPPPRAAPCPTRSPSTPTSWSPCSTTGSARCARRRRRAVAAQPRAAT